MKEAGYEIRYVPEAVVHNKGPETVGDFIRQRRRIAAGHLHLLKSQGYRGEHAESSEDFAGIVARAYLGRERDNMDLGGHRIGSAKQVPGLVGFLCAEEESVYMGRGSFNQETVRLKVASCSKFK